MIQFLKNLLSNRKFDFKIDTDGDGEPLARGEINLGELLDEFLKFKK